MVRWLGTPAFSRTRVSYGQVVRIAHVSDCYLPRTGGIETQVRALALQQAASGHEVRVITATAGAGEVFSGREIVDGLPVDRVAARIPGALPIHPRTRAHVSALLAREPADVVHVHAGVISPFAWGAVRAARERRLPVLVTVHSIWGPIARPGFAASAALTRWTDWGVQLSAVSDTAADRIAAAVPGAGEVLVVPNGIDPTRWTGYRVEGEPDELRLATVMRLAPRKRVLPLLRVVEQVRRALAGSTRVSLSIVGDGPERRRAEAFIRERGLTADVSLLGRLDHEGIGEVFANADLYVQPSVRESFGLAALEARCAGLPVIARSQTGTTQFIRDGIEGLIVDSDVQMAQAIMRVARDRVLLERMAAFNRDTPPEDTWPGVLAAVEAAYARAVRLRDAQ